MKIMKNFTTLMILILSIVGCEPSKPVASPEDSTHFNEKSIIGTWVAMPLDEDGGYDIPYIYQITKDTIFYFDADYGYAEYNPSDQYTYCSNDSVWHLRGEVEYDYDEANQVVRGKSGWVSIIDVEWFIEYSGSDEIFATERIGLDEAYIWDRTGGLRDAHVFRTKGFKVIGKDIKEFDYENVKYPQGAIKGVFSVSDTKKVAFSQGNLQYQASTNTWRFAEHQYDMVGMGYGLTNEDEDCYVAGNVQNSDNRKISSTYTGWIDLFGWGTGNNPIITSYSGSDYSTFVDWGVNKISNGGNQANLWQALTIREWEYLLHSRLNASAKQGVAYVNGINGLVLLPDNWTLPSGAHFTSGYADDFGSQYYQTVNTYTISEWQIMESAGAVFLPAAGSRGGTSVRNVGYYGYYWCSAANNKDDAVFMDFCSDKDSSLGSSGASGRSVRLSSEVK